MDEELQQLEAELKALRPAALSPELSARVKRELSAARPHNQWWLWAALPAAAALALLFTNPDDTNSSAPVVQAARPVSVAKPVFKPVASENVLLAARDEGLLTLPDGSAARRVRRSYLDTITWKDPRGQASLKWSVPRVEERIVPVVFQ